MKRAFISIIVAFVAFSAQADSIIVNSGDFNFLYEAGSTAIVEIDFSSAVVEDGETIDEYLKRNGEDYVKDWPDVQQETKKFLCDVFNRKSKNGLQLSMADTGTYKMTIKINEIDFGNTANAIIFNPLGGTKQGGAKMVADVDVVNVATGENVCSLYVSVQGFANFSESSRIKVLYTTFTKELFKAAKKFNKAKK